MKKKIGNERRKAIKKRLNQLVASPNFGVYLTRGLGKPHPLFGNLKGSYGIGLTRNVRLVVRPDTISLEPENLKECEIMIIKG